MDKESSVISRIKNGIMSIISRLKEKNTEPDITDEKEQPVDSESISRSETENKAETCLNENKELLIDFKKELGESIDSILNKLVYGIRGLLEDEYKDRLEGLERSIEELKKEKEEKIVSDLKAYKEELKDVRNLAETAKSSSEENVEKIAKITIEESEIEELKRKIEKIGEKKLPDVLRDESKGTTTVSDYIKQAPEEVLKPMRNLEESEILELKNKLEKIRDMKLSDISDDKLNGITAVLDYKKKASDEDIKAIGEMGSYDISEEKLKRLRIIMGIYGRLPGGSNKESKLDKSTLLSDFLERLQDRVNNMNIRLLHNEGVMLLRKGAFRKADVCFTAITNLDPNLKGAWLNKGFALGKLGNIDEEIRCYEKALGYLFSWSSVPGDDKEKLVRFLSKDLEIDWAENAEIKKSNDSMTISIFKDENTAKIIMDDKKEKAILKISDGRSIDLKVKKEKDKLNIYALSKDEDRYEKAWHNLKIAKRKKGKSAQR